MISYLKGKVLAKGLDSIIVEVGNIGYKVFCAGLQFANAQQGGDIELYCYLHLKQDETIELYGVPSFEALQLFGTLRGISGIGPKAALAISSLGTPEKLKHAIETNNTAFFRGVRGLGAKKIQKVMLELTGKIKEISKSKEPDDDALEGLVSLGFSRQKAKEALAKVSPSIQNAEERVKAALKLMRS